MTPAPVIDWTHKAFADRILRVNISKDDLEYAQHILDTNGEDRFFRLMIRFAHFRDTLSTDDAEFVMQVASTCDNTYRSMYKHAKNDDETERMFGDRSLAKISRITLNSEFVKYLDETFEFP